MDKFENEEKFGFYYESDQDSHLVRIPIGYAIARKYI